MITSKITFHTRSHHDFIRGNRRTQYFCMCDIAYSLIVLKFKHLYSMIIKQVRAYFLSKASRESLRISPLSFNLCTENETNTCQKHYTNDYDFFHTRTLPLSFTVSRKSGDNLWKM